MTRSCPSMRNAAFSGGAIALALAAVCSTLASAAAPSGGFFAVLNTQSNNGDSPKSITFFDTDEIATGAASPIFSVNVPGDQYGLSSYNRDEPSTMAVDPATGDVYVLAFDSGNPAVVDPNVAGLDSPDDNDGDWDLFRIDFGLVYDHWSTNFEGTTVARIPDLELLDPGLQDPTRASGRVPNATEGTPVGGLDDYITYNSTPRYNLGPGFGLHFDSAAGPHSNTFRLDGAITKLGEVKRASGDGSFYNPELQFLEDGKLLLIDNSGEVDPVDGPAPTDDHEYRLIERVSTTPGLADDSVKDHGDGGFNNIASPTQPFGSTESWESRIIGRVNLDFAETSEGSGVFEPAGHSEVESGAYFKDPTTGVEGFWVTESDSTGPDAAFPNERGDTVAFYDLTTNSYRPLSGMIELGFSGESFSADNDPFNDDMLVPVEGGEPGEMRNDSLDDGQLDNVFVDADTGDLIFIESGFGDADAGIETAGDGGDPEPGVLRLSVESYDAGGTIELGSWSEKVFLDPAKNDGGSIDDDTGLPFRALGAYSSYDSENDLVYFFSPGGAGEYSFGPNGVDDGGPDEPGSDDVDASFQMDIFVLDINSGVTTSLLNVDDSVGFVNAFGDFTEFFSLEAETGIAGDFNNDGVVDAADYTVWRDAFDGGGSLDFNETASLGVVDDDDRLAWANNYGASAASLAIPEPAAALLAGVALVAVSRRRG